MHQRFHYQNLAELEAEIAKQNLPIVLERDLSSLKRQTEIYHLKTPNSIGIHPMEGCDGTLDGKPDDLTIRRYERFAAGGAGLIWFEATAVDFAGRANPRQLFAAPENTAALAALLEKSQQKASSVLGPNHQFVPVLQLTHSGRYSKPEGKPRPIIAQHNPFLDPKVGIDSSYPTITDDELERLEDKYVAAAKIAAEAGFPIIDIKSCHRYLISELLGSHIRPGRYGGSFENRTRFLMNIIGKIQAELGNKIAITLRLNAWDGLPYPYGWGVNPATEGSEPGSLPLDLNEPKQLIAQLYQKGIRFVSISIANPYYNPHFNRPYDSPANGLVPPDEHPLFGVSRIFSLTRELKNSCPEMKIMGTGYSWLRQFAVYAAAANLQMGHQDIAGFGREAFAYPDFVKDVLEKGTMDPNKACIACSKCTDIMRDGGRTGCVIRDGGVYMPIYQEGVRNRQVK
ncbi:2,4-dienoyl-CoA reductase-like NADH-dependent reductase (Old Yellow Enzyme family) [Hydrogenispora ethanolica]|uniref:2,4-dienoyl-CoA reductase-like NADH-dependent reductase (Old Yellow Enzyme family) n=1 Tax=Hydrogenispora ethanolica TaxID=1082276 RepID=A0A4R1RTS3_HYDET|nr:flavin oxidoreductase/NADH oxidase [Hydrogenispora ethanolica]TCL69392.1 2,4-dienoyl-CoA reductase-like NADH-dependent reductase (Old Yellow Enzyme family) [Hydrogenispora ethanolica]